MSRAVRKQLLESLETLQEANDTLVQLFEKDDINEAFELLVSCQECAVMIGKRIDGLYGENTESVHGLEMYCEIIYQISQTEELSGALQLCKRAEEQLAHIGKYIEKEIPNKLEVVFLPYNVTMWDSLESIWLAAKEEDDCDAYVVPIPYYDKDKNGQQGTIHYDGGDYPEYVPVTHYKVYDLEKRHPDIIFIHNPYDGGNKVTSIHPFFYSQNLKKFTEMLVYVPYFVLDGTGIGESLVLTTGVLNADYVIVQNEKEKEEYVGYFKKHYPQIEIEDKLLPLGSPKLDKARSLTKESVKIPQAWLELCEGKRVILYNTNIVGILSGNEQYLKKMENVFEFFKSREELVLLWRPHPLMEQTIVSLRSELYGEYMQLKERFLQENIGIYDDGKDMYPGIALSDMYYGDWSSMVWLYREIGKPVRVQNVNVVEDVLGVDILEKRDNYIKGICDESIGCKIYKVLRHIGIV